MTFKHRINTVIAKALGSYAMWQSRTPLSWWRTFFVNFYFLPLSQAIKLPIYVYGKLRFTKLEGKIILDCTPNEIKRGMIKLNINLVSIGKGGADSEIVLGKGSIVFHADTFVGRNGKILIWGDGVLELGEKIHLNDGFSIGCSCGIKIGSYSRLAPDCTLFDTDFHFTYNEKMSVRRNNAKIELGHHNWIGAKSSIMKGVKLPNYTSVASNSVVNKSLLIEERSLLAGAPARVVKENFTRIFNFREECKIAAYFSDNKDENNYFLYEPREYYDS